MALPEDLEGNKYHRLTVISLAGNDKWGGRVWSCRCECGTIKDVSASDLKKGNTTSCGCRKIELAREAAREKFTTHGGSYTDEYSVWRGMINRCSDLENESYGQRGIAVYPEWEESFDAFLRDMGSRPTPNHTLERKVVNGNYEPGNCEWATWDVQSKNKRSTRYVDYEGKKYVLADLAIETGTNYGLLRYRIDTGMTPEEAVKSLWEKYGK